MKKFLFVLLISLNVFATTTEQNLNFYYSGFEGRNRVYLACDFAESSAIELLEQLGAYDIEVYCSGGIDFGRMFPISLRGNYVVDNSRSGETIEIKSNFNTNCYLNTRFLDNVLKTMDHIEVVKKRSYCFDSDSSYNYILKFK